uniref:(California timema) hypothetical protein n=1 Tax=Timema californicum TaxID=61474 RepID=A0A7R9P739_TIMCA|nr:unnamed protein product [Timema californicum]
MGLDNANMPSSKIFNENGNRVLPNTSTHYISSHGKELKLSWARSQDPRAPLSWRRVFVPPLYLTPQAPVELEESEPAFAWRKSGKPYRKNHPQFTRPRFESRSPRPQRLSSTRQARTFFYVFIVCGASTGEGGFAVTSASMSSSGLMATALASGFAMATLTQCFGHISGAHVNPSVTVSMVVLLYAGAHVNPSVTVAMAVTRNVSALRAFMFVTAQCGGGIAGAALLYG